MPAPFDSTPTWFFLCVENYDKLTKIDKSYWCWRKSIIWQKQLISDPKSVTNGTWIFRVATRNLTEKLRDFQWIFSGFYMKNRGFPRIFSGKEFWKEFLGFLGFQGFYGKSCHPDFGSTMTKNDSPVVCTIAPKRERKKSDYSCSNFKGD